MSRWDTKPSGRRKRAKRIAANERAVAAGFKTLEIVGPPPKARADRKRWAKMQLHFARHFIENRGAK